MEIFLLKSLFTKRPGSISSNTPPPSVLKILSTVPPVSYHHLSTYMVFYERPEEVSLITPQQHLIIPFEICLELLRIFLCLNPKSDSHEKLIVKKSWINITDILFI